MELKITSNFSFGKLLGKIEEIQNDFLKKNINKTVDIAKSNISQGNTRGLADSTKQSRAKGRGWAGKKVTPTNDTTPLKHTGKLLKSLKPKSDGFEIVEYGLIHQSGWTTNRGTTINPRPFLPFTSKGNLSPERKKHQKKFLKLLYLRIRQAMTK